MLLIKGSEDNIYTWVINREFIREREGIPFSIHLVPRSAPSIPIPNIQRDQMDPLSLQRKGGRGRAKPTNSNICPPNSQTKRNMG